MRFPPRSVAKKMAIASLLVLAATVARGADLPPRSTFDAASSDRPAPPRFQISGSVTGLYPGVRTGLRLTLRNPNPFAIVVTRIRTAVTRTKGGCPPGAIKIGRFSGSRRIAALGVVRVKVTARMRSKAPDACAGSRSRLSYRGWARHA